MSGVLSQLKTVIKDLNDIEVEWALVGALAYSVHCEPRTTRDIDVAVVLEGVNRDRIRQSILSSESRSEENHRDANQVDVPVKSITFHAKRSRFTSDD